MLKVFTNVVDNYSSCFKILESEVLQRGTGNPVTTTFVYVYLVVLPVITIMSEWQFVHLCARMYGYIFLEFKNISLHVSRKLQK